MAWGLLGSAGCEDDRFETQLNQVIRAYVDVAKTCIRVFDADKDILPEISNRVSIKWSDIVKESDNMSIQYSGADSLSKDPSTKLHRVLLDFPSSDPAVSLKTDGDSTYL